MIAQMSNNIVHQLLGYEGPDREALAAIVPLPAEARKEVVEVPLHQLLTDAVETSMYGELADRLWSQFQDVKKYKGIVLPDGIDLNTAKAQIKRATNITRQYNSRSIVTALVNAESRISDGDYI